MVLLNKTKEGLYIRNKSKITLLNAFNRRTNNMIFFFGNSQEDFNIFMNSKLFDLDEYKGLYHPKFLDGGKIFNRKELFNQVKYYKEMKERYNNLSYFKYHPSQYNGYNLIYDMTFMYHFFHKINRTGVNKVNTFQEFFSKIIFDNEFSNYNHKYILVPLDFTVTSMITRKAMINNLNSSNPQISENTDLFSFNLNIINTISSINNRDINPPVYSYLNQISYGINKNKKIDGHIFNVNPFVNPSNLKLIKESATESSNSLSNTQYIIFYSIRNNSYFYYSIDDTLDYVKFKHFANYMIKSYNGRQDLLTNEEINIKKDETNKVKENFIKKILSSLDVSKGVITNKTLNDEIAKFENSVFSITGNVENEEILEEIINKTPGIIESLKKIEKYQLSGRINDPKFSEVEKKKIEKLSLNQEKFLDTPTISNIIKKYHEKKINVEKILDKNIINDELRFSVIKDFDRSYNENLFDSDIYKIFKYFSTDKYDPFFISDIKKEKSSDNLNYKETYTVKYSGKTTQTTIKVDIPIIVDDIFIYLNGSKKNVIKQITSLPLTKADPDEVFLTTNYNKFQIVTSGTKISPNIEKFLKTLDDDSIKASFAKNGISVKYGLNIKSNEKFTNTLEYNYLSRYISMIKIKDVVFYFNRDTVDEILSTIDQNKLNITQSTDYEYHPSFIFGINNSKDKFYYIRDNGSVLLYDAKTSSNSFIEENIVLAISNILEKQGIPEFINILINENTGKIFKYSSVSILNKKIPLCILLSFYLGLSRLLELTGIKFWITNKNEFPPISGVDFKKSPQLRMYYRSISFKDAKLWYKDNIITSMLFNGFAEMNTSLYDIAELDTESPYIEHFGEVYSGKRNVSKGFRLILDRMMDPITVEICEDLDLPITIEGLLLKSNEMIANVSLRKKNDMSLYRIRGNEIIASYLYKILADQFNIYRSTGLPFSVPKDILIKKLLESKAIENYSILNPTSEILETNKASWRGPVGINLDDAYTKEIRSYSSTMKGIFGGFSAPDANVGSKRYFTYNPAIKNLRGYLSNSEDKEINGPETYISAELLNPFTTRHTDPPRLCMSVRQAAHVVPTKNTDAPIIMSGVEKTLAQSLHSDFIYIAKKDGRVIKIDDNNKFIHIKYNDNTDHVVDMSDKISYNSASGFFIDNKFVSEYKEGQTFKAGDVIARNNDFFKLSDEGEIQFATGTLSKVALAPTDRTMEDSSFITNKFAKKMSSSIITKEELTLSVNTNIQRLAKIGDHINIGDPLCIFETSSDNDAVNLLDKLGKDFKQHISELASTVKKSHYTGEIVDIKIYYNHDIKDFTPSLKKVINNYLKNIKTRQEAIESISSEPVNIYLPQSEKIDGLKIKNSDVDGVLIEFYIKHQDVLKTGDKITMQAACKTIISETLVDGSEPYSEYRSEEDIDVIFSPLSVIGRMTVDILMQMYSQKVLVEASKRIGEMANSED